MKLKNDPDEKEGFLSLKSERLRAHSFVALRQSIVEEVRRSEVRGDEV